MAPPCFFSHLGPRTCTSIESTPTPERMCMMTRRFALVLRAGATIAAIGVAFQTTTSSAAKSAGRIGDPRPGRNALEFIGKLDQLAATHEAYGYLTHIDGLPDGQLFSHPTLW